MTTLQQGARVMRSSKGNRPDGPWIILGDLTHQNGRYLLAHEAHGPHPAWVTVEAYPSQLEILEAAPAPCPGCGSHSPAHFSVRVGTEIPARFTPCPWEVAS